MDCVTNTVTIKNCAHQIPDLLSAKSGSTADLETKQTALTTVNAACYSPVLRQLAAAAAHPSRSSTGATGPNEDFARQLLISLLFVQQKTARSVTTTNEELNVNWNEMSPRAGGAVTHVRPLCPPRNQGRNTVAHHARPYLYPPKQSVTAPQAQSDDGDDDDDDDESQALTASTSALALAR
jgi:hypothetical protein